MMHGQSLSATLPEDSGLDERFWYWCGASGRRYIHSIYRRNLCPPVPGAVFVLVALQGGSRQAVAVGRFGLDVSAPGFMPPVLQVAEEEEIHIHLLSREEDVANLVLCDLLAAMSAAPHSVVEPSRPLARPVQLELLAA